MIAPRAESRSVRTGTYLFHYIQEMSSQFCSLLSHPALIANILQSHLVKSWLLYFCKKTLPFFQSSFTPEIRLTHKMSGKVIHILAQGWILSTPPVLCKIWVPQGWAFHRHSQKEKLGAWPSSGDLALHL